MIYILKIVWIYLLVIFFSSNLKAQLNVDSLKDELKVERKGKKKVSLLIQIGEYYINISPDSTLKYSEESLQLSKKLNFNEGKANTYLLAGKAFIEKKQYQTAIDKIQLSENIYHILNDEIGLGNCFYEKSFPYSRISESDSCTFYLDKAFEIFKFSNNLLQLTNIEKVRGLNYWSLGKYGEGLISTDKAIKGYLQLNDSINLSKALNTKGAILWGLACYDKALENFFESLYLKEKLGNKNDQLIIAYNNIGLVYHDWGNDNSAINYYRKAEKLIPHTENKLGITYTYLNLGSYYFRKGDLNKALELLEKSKKGYAEINDINGVCLCKIRIAHCYNHQGNFNKARITFLDAIKDAEKSKNTHRIALAYYYLGNNDFSLNDLKNSLTYSLKSLELAEAGKYKDVQQLLYEQLSQIYEQQGKLNLSLEMLKKAAVFKDEIYKEKIAVQYEIMELTRENEQKEFENSKLKSQNILKEKTIQYQTIAVIMAMLLLFAVLIFYYRLSKKKKDLQKANRSKDKIFSIVSHDLRGPVGNLNNMIDMLVTEEDKEDYRKLLHLLKPVITSSYNMLENLLVWAKSNLGKLEFKGDNIYINSVIKETIVPIINIAEKKSISIHFNPVNDLKVFADRILLETTIRNLLNNAVKFTNELGKIEIEAVESNKQVVISVIDNGIGISKEKQELLFNGNANTLGTNNETGSGLGLLLCNELVQKNGGSLWVKSSESKGSTFSFSVPATPNYYNN